VLASCFEERRSGRNSDAVRKIAEECASSTRSFQDLFLFTHSCEFQDERAREMQIVEMR